jgi:hypothetical protein
LFNFGNKPIPFEMKLLTEGKSIKIQNFVEYLIEHFKNKGKTYEFEIHIDDRYDKKMLENRESSLKDNILLKHNDGFDILSHEFLSDFDKFKEKIKQFTDNESLIQDLNKKKFHSQFVNYKISFIDEGQKHIFEFSFFDLTA